jgi:hypothetical protein
MTDGANRPAGYPGTPRWVKILGAVTLALVVTFVIVHLAGGGFCHHAHLGHRQPDPMHDGP